MHERGGMEKFHPPLRVEAVQCSVHVMARGGCLLKSECRETRCTNRESDRAGRAFTSSAHLWIFLPTAYAWSSPRDRGGTMGATSSRDTKRDEDTVTEPSAGQDGAQEGSSDDKVKLSWYKSMIL